MITTFRSSLFRLTFHFKPWTNLSKFNFSFHFLISVVSNVRKKYIILIRCEPMYTMNNPIAERKKALAIPKIACSQMTTVLNTSTPIVCVVSADKGP